MSTGILLLSPELHLRIIDFILEQPDEEDKTEDGKEKETKLDERSDSTEHLVPVNLKTLIKLSQTCSAFRALLAPSIYTKLYLTNTKSSADSVKAVAEGPFRDQVTEVLFVGRAPGSEEEGFDDTETVFPEEVENVLKNLNDLFPRLNSLNVGFAYELNDYDKWDVWVWESFLDEEADEQVLEEEKSQGFRALIAKVWTAISCNPSIKHLKMRQFIPKWSSVYSSKSFHAFLSAVQKFDMSTWGDDNGAGWVSNFGEGYCQGLARLDCIFDALKSCTEFTLEASKYGLYGLEGQNHAPHGFRLGQMPQLRRFKLRHCFISPELRMLFKEHKDTLEEVVLQDCGASTNTYSGLAENGISWQELFEAMLCMRALKKFEVLSVHGMDPLDEETKEAPRSEGEGKGEAQEEEKEQEEPKKKDKPANPDKKRWIFPYGICKFRSCSTFNYFRLSDLQYSGQ